MALFLSLSDTSVIQHVRRRFRSARLTWFPKFSAFSASSGSTEGADRFLDLPIVTIGW